MIVLPGFAHAGAVLTDRGAMTRASRVGTNVASQIGRNFDSAEYLGPQKMAAAPTATCLSLNSRATTIGSGASPAAQQGSSGLKQMVGSANLGRGF